MVIVAFGLTGDLMQRKILPALFALHSRGEFTEPLRIVGLSRKGSGKFNFYTLIQGDASDSASFEEIKRYIGDEREVIFYLSVAPELYVPIIEQIKNNGLASPHAKIIIEKPFGSSGASSEALEDTLHSVFSEEQIYRVDHYLAKDAVGEIVQAHIEPAGIASITVRLLEVIGVEARGALYDKVGALRDVGQNHLLEIVAVAIGGPRAQALARLSPATMSARAQYKGYDSIPGVAPNSQTETYFKIQCTLGDVEVVLESGKKMPADIKEIKIGFKDGTSRTFSLASGHEYEKLLQAALHGEHEMFVSSAEVKALWQFVDPILEAWSKGTPPLGEY